MAVFKQELNWSTYQNNQLKVLESIEKSLNTSLQIGQHLANTMNKVEYAITSIAYASEASAKNLSAMTKKSIGSAVEFNGRMDQASKATSEFKIQLGETSKKTKEFQQNIQDAGATFTSVVRNLGSRFYDHLGRLDGIGRDIDRFSEASNQMIRLSGMNGNLVQGFRAEIRAIVSELNGATGNLYSQQDAYEKVISISQGVTSNLDAMEEMARPLLLSYETLDVNVNTVADLFNRFYTRYTFSSENMEESLNEIRGNTAGNSASAEATIENIRSLEQWINLYAGNDNDLRESLLEEVSHYTSWVESMGLDSKALTDYINIAASGDIGSNRELVEILSRVGITSTSATIMARTGQYEELTQAIIDGIYDTMIDHFGSREEILNGGALALGPALKNIGLSEELALEVLNIKDATGYISLDDFLENQSKNTSTMEELAEDKYVSMEDKVTNEWLEKIYSVAATIQEKVGIGFSDIALIAAMTRGLLWGKGEGSNLLPKLIGSQGVTSSASPWTGGLRGAGILGAANTAGSTTGLALGSTAATVVGSAGLLAGGALAFDGISGVFDSEKTKGYRVGSGIEAAAGIAGTGLLLASNPIGWAALVGGGLAYLGKSAYENAHELSGNAKDIEKQIGDIGDSLKKENAQRLSDISELRYQFTQETDIEKQRQLLEESGLFNKEDLQNKEEEQLLALIDSYKNSVSALDEVTEGALKLADKFYTDQQNEQQKDFIEDLKSADLTESQMTDIISLLQTSVTDDDLLEKFSKALEDENITKDEFNDLLYGGKNSWFDKNNLEDKGLDVAGMQRVAGYLGWDNSYVTADNMEEVVKLYNKFADPTNSEEDRKAAWEAIVNSGLEDEVRNIYGNQLKVYGYSDGSNYITRDQLAMIHEGEAIVPKKYNPAANNEELKRAIEYLESTNSTASRDSERYFASFLEELQAIREFLEEWKSYNAQKDKMNEIKSRYSTSRALISQYFT